MLHCTWRNIQQTSRTVEVSACGRDGAPHRVQLFGSTCRKRLRWRIRMSGSVHRLIFTIPCWSCLQWGHFQASSGASCKQSERGRHIHVVVKLNLVRWCPVCTWLLQVVFVFGSPTLIDSTQANLEIWSSVKNSELPCKCSSGTTDRLNNFTHFHSFGLIPFSEFPSECSAPHQKISHLCFASPLLVRASLKHVIKPGVQLWWLFYTLFKGM